MPSADLQGATLGQVAIRVHDVGRATAFYRDQLGLPLLFEFTGLAFFRCGDVRLMLSTAEKPEFDHPASILYYRVPDVEASYAELGARGRLRRHTSCRSPHPDLGALDGVLPGFRRKSCRPDGGEGSHLS